MNLLIYYFIQRSKYLTYQHNPIYQLLIQLFDHRNYNNKQLTQNILVIFSKEYPKKPPDMNNILEQYCSISESIAFNNSSNEFHQYHHLNENHLLGKFINKIKCFNCYDQNVNNEQVDDEGYYCVDCGNTKYVLGLHPLALMLNDVMERKLVEKVDKVTIQLTEKKNYDDEVEYMNRLSCGFDLEPVEVIREQEEEMEEKKIQSNKMIIQKNIQNLKQRSNQIHPIIKNKNHVNFNLNIKNYQNQQDDQTNSNNQEDISDHSCTTSKSIYQNNDKPNFKLTSSQIFQDCESEPQIDTDTEFLNNLDYINEVQIKTEEFKELVYSREDNLISNNHELHVNETSSVSQISECEFQAFKFALFKPDLPSEKNKNVNFNVNIDYRESINFYSSNIQKSDCNDIRESFGFVFGSQAQASNSNCNNCSEKLNDLYCVCRTCQKQMLVYRICNECSDNDEYNHDRTHQMDMVLFNVLGRKSQYVVQEDENQQNKRKSQRIKLNKKMSICDQVFRDQDDEIEETVMYSAEKKVNREKQKDCFQRDFMLSQSKFVLRENYSLKMDTVNMKNESDSQFKQQQQKIQKCFQQSQVAIEWQSTMFNSSIYNQQCDIELSEIKLKMKRSSHEQNKVHHNDKQSAKQNIFHHFNVNNASEKMSNYDVNNSIEEFEQLSTSQNDEFKVSKLRKKLKKRQSKTQKCINHQNQHSQSQFILTTQFYKDQKVNVNDHEHKSNILNQDKIIKQDEYIFHSYKCDECGCDPIKNVKYHCLMCEDFDVCGKCYSDKFLETHPHEFEKIDGLKRLKEQKQQTIKMLQRKDLNRSSKGTSNLNVQHLQFTSNYHFKETSYIYGKNIQQSRSTIHGIKRTVKKLHHSLIPASDKQQYYENLSRFNNIRAGNRISLGDPYLRE